MTLGSPTAGASRRRTPFRRRLLRVRRRPPTDWPAPYSWGVSDRAEDARRRLELAQSGARAEAVAAQRLIDEFVRQARAKGIAPEPLRARLIGGPEVRTDRTGWYIRANRSVAIGEDGAYYLLTVPGAFTDRFRGVKLEPTQPVLVVNRGGRDGDSGDLAEFLDARLALG